MEDHEIITAAHRVTAGKIWNGAWPHGAQIAVALSFDVDHETPWIRDQEFSINSMSMGAYGSHAGLPRILSSLKERDLPATFFIPGLIASLHPGDIEKIAAQKHEIALHGWLHERHDLLSREEEVEVLRRSIETLTQHVGIEPRGIRAPSLSLSNNSLPLAVEAGLIYDSSLMAHDEPYEIIIEGQRSGLIEIPVDWSRDDAAFFVTERFSSLRSEANPQHAVNAWKLEFQKTHQERGLFQITLHPELMGRRSRWIAFEAMLDELMETSHVWFATHLQIAEHVRASLIS